MNCRTFCIFIFVELFLILFLQSDDILVTEAQSHRSVTPLNIGWVFSLPWDVSNTLRAPLAGPLSIVLAGGLACVMMFGLFIAPIYYLFGDPERPYHYHDADKDGMAEILTETVITGRGYAPFDRLKIKTSKYFDNSTTEGRVTNFMESAFFLLPENEEDCKKLLVCHAHGFLSYLPHEMVKVFRVFSKKIPAVPTAYQDAIARGLKDQSNCQLAYPCSRDITEIAKATLFHIVPK